MEPAKTVEARRIKKPSRVWSPDGFIRIHRPAIVAARKPAQHQDAVMISETDATTRPEHDHSGDYCPACEAAREAGKAALADWAERHQTTQQYDAETVQNILQLHAMFEPIGAIAKATGLPEPVCSFVIQRKRLPEEQPASQVRCYESRNTCPLRLVEFLSLGCVAQSQTLTHSLGAVE